MAWKIDGAKERALLTVGGLIIAGAIAAYWIYADHKQRSEAAFHGFVVEKFWRRSTKFGMDPTKLALAEDGSSGVLSLRSPHFYVGVQTDLTLVDYELYEHELREVALGDYVVKLPGQERLALYRDGKQLVGYGGFRDDPIPLPEILLKKIAVASDPAPPAEPKPTQDATIRGLLDQASQLWRAGEKEASIMASEKALAVTDMAYGRKSAQYQELSNRIEQAKKVMKQ